MKKRYKSSNNAIILIISLFILTLCGGFSVYVKEYRSALAIVAAALVVAVSGAISGIINKKKLNKYIEIITAQSAGMSSGAIQRFPIPMAVLQVNGQISWYNDLFAEMLGSNDIYSIVISDIMPDLKWSEILKSTHGISTYAGYKNHHYHIVGDIVKTPVSTEENPDYTVLLYFIDRTEVETLKKRYENERTDIAIVNIDNYDEIFQKLDDSESQQTLSKIHKYISDWAGESKGVLKKTERDRYIVYFEHQYLKEYVEKKFSLLENVRALGDGLKMPLSISVGIGVGGNILENDAYARAALDMALGRGGDQVAVKDATQYNFYGGIAKDYERSTRVKTRSFAIALKDFMAKADKVIFMGHQGLDYDAFGAAIGLQRAVRALNKEPYIVMDSSPAVSKMAEEVAGTEEYNGMLISTETALDIVTENTLLIIIDTHRASMLPVPELLERTAKVVIIDHHRRCTDFLADVSLFYHEPYASSTCEMATEILQYIDNSKNLTSFEAKALYTGILMDTKNFGVKTGVRTFEAASYLRRYGLNPQDVRKFFEMDKDTYVTRAEIIKNSVLISKGILVSVCRDARSNIKVIASQAADEMLNLDGIHTAFVVYPMDTEIGVSARSLGTVNVQVIAEKLGGGGHATVAGAQVKNSTVEEVHEKLGEAIYKYLEDNKKD